MRTEPERLGHMADVATAAGVAKGTVYLYFESKEALLLALHERHVEAFFGALIARVEMDARASLTDIMQIAREHIVVHPTYLPCASVCYGAMERSMPLPLIQAHRQRVAVWFSRAAETLPKHFSQLDNAHAISLLRLSYALIIGLWQLLKPESLACLANDDSISDVLRAEFSTEVEKGLLALWDGQLHAAMHRPISP